MWQNTGNVRQAQGEETGERLTLKCIDGDLCSYPTKILSLTIQGWCFYCSAGIAPQLGTPVLIRRDCPILMLLMTPQLCPENGEAILPILNGNEKREAPPMPVDPGELVKLTQQDPTLDHTYLLAKEPPSSSYTWPYFSRHNSLLYHHEWEKSQLVVPQALKAQLYLAHEVPLAGHQAAERTLEHLTKHFYWPNIRAQVSKHCVTCADCQLMQPKGASGGLLQLMPIVSMPSEHIGIDLV